MHVIHTSKTKLANRYIADFLQFESKIIKNNSFYNNFLNSNNI